MTRELQIQILKADKCTTTEAISLIADGTTIVEESEIQSFLKEWNSSAYDEDDILTIEKIESGNAENITSVNYDNQKYYIFYVV